MTSTVTVAGVEVATGHWIAGHRVDEPERVEVRSPIDGRLLGDVSDGSTAAVDSAVSAARAAFPGWASLGSSGRGRILQGFAERIRTRLDDVARVETEDNGSLLLANQRNIIERAARNIEYFAEFAERRPDEVIEGPVVDNHVRYEPAGVAAVITPWNAPFMLTTWRIGPALAAGNTVVLKPPEWAPFSCSLLADLAAEAGVPPGVLNVVQGFGTTAGATLVAHPGVDRISFTGSVETGRVIGAVAGQQLKPVSFELGGKSPFIVFDDADLDNAAKTVAHQFINAGQVCLAGTRVLVKSTIAQRFLELVLAAKDRLPVGDPRDPAVRIGPLIHPEHFGRVDGYVKRAIAAGAELICGGGQDRFGDLYYQPTILRPLHQHDEVVRNEVFGPVLTLQSFEDESEAVQLANDTRYGLAAMLYTRDHERAERVSSALVAGTVWVNCFFVRDLAAPFGGSRTSGIGREGGRWSFDFHCDVKNIAIQRGAFAEDGSRG